MKKLNKPEILEDSNNHMYYPDHMNHYMMQAGNKNAMTRSVDRNYTKSEIEAFEKEYNSKRRQKQNQAYSKINHISNYQQIVQHKN